MSLLRQNEIDPPPSHRGPYFHSSLPFLQHISRKKDCAFCVFQVYTRAAPIPRITFAINNLDQGRTLPSLSANACEERQSVDDGVGQISPRMSLETSIGR